MEETIKTIKIIKTIKNESITIIIHNYKLSNLSGYSVCSPFKGLQTKNEYILNQSLISYNSRSAKEQLVLLGEIVRLGQQSNQEVLTFREVSSRQPLLQ
jgi:ABC-type amino acid transport system permease subunit